MNDLQIFKSNEFGEIPVIVHNEKEYFGASEVASALGYTNPRDALLRHCKEEGVAKHDILTNGGMQEKKFISESNLYRLIVKSQLPSAEKFEKWVFEEVLPSIRKNGAYMTPETIEKTLTNPDFIIDLATRLKDEQQKRVLAEKKIEEQKPMVLFAQAVEVSNTSILIGDLAKILRQNGIDIGQNRLFTYLRNQGYLIKRPGDSYNMPTQKGMELELFEVKERTVNNPDGSVRITKTPKVTGKGQIYFINKFKKCEVAV